MERRRFISDCVTKAAEELGYPTMKMEQLDVTIAFVEGRDVFAILPTGFGKSLFYACLPASFAFDRMLEQDQGNIARGRFCHFGTVVVNHTIIT